MDGLIEEDGRLGDLAEELLMLSDVANISGPIFVLFQLYYILLKDLVTGYT